MRPIFRSGYYSRSEHPSPRYRAAGKAKKKIKCLIKGRRPSESLPRPAVSFERASGAGISYRRGISPASTKIHQFFRKVFQAHARLCSRTNKWKRY